MKRSTFELGLISPSYLIPTQWLAGSNSFFFIPGWAKKVLRIMPVVMITHKYFQDEVFYYFLLQLLASKLCSNTQGKSVSWHLGRVYFRARHCGISAIWKKMPHKIVFHQKLMEKAYFIFKMTGAAMVQPASSDFWKAPLVRGLHLLPLWLNSP